MSNCIAVFNIPFLIQMYEIHDFIQVVLCVVMLCSVMVGYQCFEDLDFVLLQCENLSSCFFILCTVYIADSERIKCRYCM